MLKQSERNPEGEDISSYTSNRKDTKAPCCVGELLLLSAFVIEIAVVLVTFWFILTSFRYAGTGLCTYHATLSLFACECLMTMGLLIQSCLSSLGKGFYNSRTKYHWRLMLAAIVCLIVGLITIVVDKTIRKQEHFLNAHAYVGFATIVLSMISAFLGLLAKFAKNTKLMASINSKKVVHYSFGIVTYFFGAISIVLSFQLDWFRNKWSPRSQNILTFSIFFTCLYASFKPWYVLLNRLRFMLRTKCFAAK